MTRIGTNGSGDSVSVSDSLRLNTINVTTFNVTGAANFVSYVDFTRISAPANPSSANMGRAYIKQIDANNDGLFILLKKAGAYVRYT